MITMRFHSSPSLHFFSSVPARNVLINSSLEWFLSISKILFNNDVFMCYVWVLWHIRRGGICVFLYSVIPSFTLTSLGVTSCNDISGTDLFVDLCGVEASRYLPLFVVDHDSYTRRGACYVTLLCRFKYIFSRMPFTLLLLSDRFLQSCVNVYLLKTFSFISSITSTLTTNRSEYRLRTACNLFPYGLVWGLLPYSQCPTWSACLEAYLKSTSMMNTSSGYQRCVAGSLSMLTPQSMPLCLLSASLQISTEVWRDAISLFDAISIWG